MVLRVDPDVTTLVDYHHEPHRHGRRRRARRRVATAAAPTATSLVLPVPDGTVVRDGDGTVLADLVGAGTELVVAQGGRGGLGNAALASARRKAPGFALKGEPGDERTIVLELKVVADVGLVGFPQRRQVQPGGRGVAGPAQDRRLPVHHPGAQPRRGHRRRRRRTRSPTCPGLIEGASEGRGLGHDFLRHIERCAALVHVVDCATPDPGRDPLTDLDVIEAELERYGGLDDRPRLVALNKVDVPEARELAEMVRPELEARGVAGAAGVRRARGRGCAS